MPVHVAAVVVVVVVAMYAMCGESEAATTNEQIKTEKAKKFIKKTQKKKQ